MSKQYTWSFEKDAERYDNDVHDTIDGCITEAKQCGAKAGDIIYVGECESFKIEVDSEKVFEQLRDEAFDFVADYGDDWADDLNFPREEREKLDQKLSQVIIDFLTAHNAMPNFYQVTDIREVVVK